MNIFLPPTYRMFNFSSFLIHLHSRMLKLNCQIDMSFYFPLYRTLWCFLYFTSFVSFNFFFQSSLPSIGTFRTYTSVNYDRNKRRRKKIKTRRRQSFGIRSNCFVTILVLEHFCLVEYGWFFLFSFFDLSSEKLGILWKSEKEKHFQSTEIIFSNLKISSLQFVRVDFFIFHSLSLSLFIYVLCAHNLHIV